MNATDRTILLTGATSGLGRAVAGKLAEEQGRLILHGRDPGRLGQLADELADAQADIDVVQADLSDLNQVKQLAEKVAELTDHLDVLVHNAGVGKGADDTRQLSADGYELRLAVNHLAPFVLTQRLLPLLETAAPSRIVNVASGAQEPIDFSDPHLQHGYSGDRAYAQSKFAMVTFGFALAKTLLAGNVDAHPNGQRGLRSHGRRLRNRCGRGPESHQQSQLGRDHRTVFLHPATRSGTPRHL